MAVDTEPSEMAKRIAENLCAWRACHRELSREHMQRIIAEGIAPLEEHNRKLSESCDQMYADVHLLPDKIEKLETALAASTKQLRTVLDNASDDDAVALEAARKVIPGVEVLPSPLLAVRLSAALAASQAECERLRDAFVLARAETTDAELRKVATWAYAKDQQSADILSEHFRDAANSIERYALDNAALRQQVERLRKDAERYRWLRKERGWERFIFVTRQSSSSIGATEVLSEGVLDAAIDNVLSAQPAAETNGDVQHVPDGFCVVEDGDGERLVRKPT